jgi:16S rRNA (cytosine1402-N4)-methyltransferase
MKYHVPVMLAECMEGLDIRKDGIYVDATFGGGGHSKKILEYLGTKGKLIAFDQDPDATVNAIHDQRFTLIQDNFKYMQQHLEKLGMIPVNGILADLGVSSHQFDVADRGFSIRFDSDLDMRMDPDSSGPTALEILNTRSEADLVKIFSNYGEVKNSKSLARAIVFARTRRPLAGAADLKETIEHLVPKAAASQYLAQVYQALRIEVNNELEALRALILQSAEVLETGGRMVIMSYHSLEDRLVKNFISKGNFEGEDKKDLFGNTLGLRFRAVTKKPVTPAESEIKNNPRSRSARLRVAEKIA